MVGSQSRHGSSGHRAGGAPAKPAYGRPVLSTGAVGESVIPSVEVTLPVPGHPTRGSRHRLVERVVKRRSEGRPLDVLLGTVVPEPVLGRLVALDDRMARFSGVATGVLGW
jgi:hypothetical protein